MIVGRASETVLSSRAADSWTFSLEPVSSRAMAPLRPTRHWSTSPTRCRRTAKSHKRAETPRPTARDHPRSLLNNRRSHNRTATSIMSILGATSSSRVSASSPGRRCPPTAQFHGPEAQLPPTPTVFVGQPHRKDPADTVCGVFLFAVSTTCAKGDLNPHALYGH